jgi:hypothetical protein
LWRAVHDAYTPDPGDEEVLLEAGRTVDELARLERALDDEPSIVSSGSRGQPVAHPLLDEVRRHRATLAALVGALSIPADDSRAARPSTSELAQRAALHRWDRRGA